MYAKGPKGKPVLNEELAPPTSEQAMAMDRAAMQRRLVQPMIDAAVKLLEEGVTDSPETIDLATVLGLGLAPFRGGLMQFAAAEPPAAVLRPTTTPQEAQPRAVVPHAS